MIRDDQERWEWDSGFSMGWELKSIGIEILMLSTKLSYPITHAMMLIMCHI